MTDTTPARRLGALVADWQRTPFQTISNEDKARREFLADLAEVLTERSAVLADNERLTADLQRAEAEVAKWVAAEAADITAGSYAGEVERLRIDLKQAIAAVERLKAELAEAKAKLAAAEKELDHRRGIRPCHRTAVHPGHLWMLDRKPVTCLGVKDAQPPAVAAPDAQDRAGRAQEGLQRDPSPTTDNSATARLAQPQCAATAPTVWTDTRDGRTYDLTHDWTDRHGLTWHCDGWHQHWTYPEPRPQMIEGVPGGAMMLDDVIDNYGPLTEASADE